MTPDILTSLLTSFVLSLSAYTVGHVVLCLLPAKREFEDFFRKMALGAFLLVVLYASIRTQGQTILLGGATILATIAIAMRKEMKWQWQTPQLSAALIFTAVLIALTLINYLSTNSLSGETFDLNQDYSFYARVIRQIDYSRIEGLGYDFANPEFSTPTLYHYGELWLSALVARISSLSAFGSFYMVILPFLGSVALMGVASVARKLFEAKGWQVVIVAMLLPVFYFQYYVGETNNVFTTIGYASLLISKLYPVIIALCAVFLSKGWHKAAILLLIPFFNSTSVAPIFAGVIIWTAYKFRTPLFITTCLSIAYFVLFYALTAKANPFLTDSFTLYEAAMQAKHQFGVISIFKNFLIPLFDLLLNLLPAAILIILLGKQRRKPLTDMLKENAVVFLVVAVAAIGYTTIWYLRDSIQTYYSVAYPLFITINVLVMVYSLNKTKGVAILILSVGAIFTFKNGSVSSAKLDERFYDEIMTEIKSNPVEEPRFAWVEFQEFNGVENKFFRDAAYRKPLYPIGRAVDSYSPVRLDPYSIVYDRADVMDASVISSIENNSFYRFVEKNGLQKDIRQAQIKYITDNRIEYLILPRGGDWIEGSGLKVKKIIESINESYSFYILEL